jgi:hypothetical protein
MTEINTFIENNMKKLTNIFFYLTLLIFISGCNFSGPEYVLKERDLNTYNQWKNKISFTSSLKQCDKYFTGVKYHNEVDTSSFDNCYAEIYVDIGGSLERPEFLIAEFKNGKISGKASGMTSGYLHLSDDVETRYFTNLYFETEDYENNTHEYKSLRAQDLPCKVQFKLKNNSDTSQSYNTYERKFICKEFTSFFTIYDTTYGVRRNGEAKIEYKSDNTWNLSYADDILVKATSNDSNGNLLFTGSYNKKLTPAYDEPKNIFSLWRGLIDAKGTLKYGDGTKITITGANDNGYLMGVITDSNGIKYEGGIFQGLPDGYVEVTDKSGYTKTVAYSKGIEVGWDMMPSKQKNLTDSIEKTYQSIRSANSAQKKQAWIDLNRELCNVEFVSTRVTDWVGYIDEIYMRDNGEIKLTIQMNQIGNNLEISSVGATYKSKILDLRENGPFSWSEKGSFIKFNGYLVKGKESENECLDKNTWDNSPELENKTFMLELIDMDVLLR